MKGYAKVHALANCRDCDWSDEWFLTAPVNGRKHNDKTGHAVSLEIGYCKEFEKKEVRETKQRGTN